MGECTGIGLKPWSSAPEKPGESSVEGRSSFTAELPSVLLPSKVEAGLACLAELRCAVASTGNALEERAELDPLLDAREKDPLFFDTVTETMQESNMENSPRSSARLSLEGTTPAFIEEPTGVDVLLLFARLGGSDDCWSWVDEPGGLPDSSISFRWGAAAPFGGASSGNSSLVSSGS